MDNVTPMDPREIQALHRRLTEARDRGVAPSLDDARAAASLKASPFSEFDRPWAPDRG